MNINIEFSDYENINISYRNIIYHCNMSDMQVSTNLPKPVPLPEYVGPDANARLAAMKPKSAERKREAG